MDEFYVCWCISMVVDAVLTLGFSIEYLNAQKLYNTFVATLGNGINSVSISKIKEASRADQPVHACIRGRVKAVGPPIKSLNKPSLSGVIQKLTIKEHAVQKNTYGMWLSREHTIDAKCNVVPFEIREGTFKVTVTSPLDARYLNLEVIEDHFEPTVSGVISSLIFGFHQKGFQYTEFLLKENAILTGFGEVSVDCNGNLQLIPPKSGMAYILTTMDPETLTQELKSRKKTCGYIAAVFAIIGICLAGIKLYECWNARKVRLEMERMRAEAAQQRERRVTNLTDESFICIVCCIQPREVVLLPCGHVSLCFDCSSQLAGQPCPVCRQRVRQQNLVYLS